MKQLYIVSDIPNRINDHSSYCYIVSAYDYQEAIKIVKERTGFKHLEFDANLADNHVVWK